MRARIMILSLGILVLPVFPQDPSPPTTEGTEQDATEEGSLSLLKMRAEQGDANAQRLLAAMYLTGQGVPQDYKEALRWARPAAEQGEARAQFLVGLMYDLGQAVPQDYVQAHMWYNLAASSLTGENRETAAVNRDRLADKMTPEDLAKAQRLAREWKPKGSGSQ